MSAIRKPFPGLYGVRAPLGCTGLLLPGLEARILRTNGSEADYDEPGELWVRGPNVALGYFGNEKATRETFVDGWLRTGDTFKADKDELL
jgi:long-subunit acyl-CoA synthetase (AMP-forming)